MMPQAPKGIRSLRVKQLKGQVLPQDLRGPFSVLMPQSFPMLALLMMRQTCHQLWGGPGQGDLLP